MIDVVPRCKKQSGVRLIKGTGPRKVPLPPAGLRKPPGSKEAVRRKR